MQVKKLQNTYKAKPYIMKKALLIITAISVAILFTGCEESNNLFNKQVDEIEDATKSAAVTIAEEEVENLKSAEATQCEENTIAAMGHMLKPGWAKMPHMKGLREHLPECVEMTVQGEEFPKTITLVYNECIDRHENARSGMITITLSDTLKNEGAVYEVSYVDFKVGKRIIDRDASYTNLGENEDGNVVFAIELNSTVSFEKKDTSYVIVREWSGTRTWLAGFGTPRFADNIFLREGSGSIIVNGEFVFTKVITEPVLIDRACRFPLSGVIEISRNDESLSLDYGDGTCDIYAVVTKDGESEEIELGSGKFREGFKRQQQNMCKENGWW